MLDHEELVEGKWHAALVLAARTGEVESRRKVVILTRAPIVVFLTEHDVPHDALGVQPVLEFVQSLGVSLFRIGHNRLSLNMDVPHGSPFQLWLYSIFKVLHSVFELAFNVALSVALFDRFALIEFLLSACNSDRKLQLPTFIIH